MGNIMIGYAILALVVALLLTAVIVRVTWGRKVKYPKGTKTVFKYNEFKSELIVDDTIIQHDDSFFVNDKKMNRFTLAKMCAMSMEAIDFATKNYGPEPLRKKLKLQNCVFVFLPEGEYYKKLQDEFGTSSKSAGFSTQLTHNMGGKPGPYVCYLNSNYMWEVYTTGYLSVHEYTHCYSHYLLGNWDYDHKIWQFKTINGKTIQQIAVERIKTKVDLDKKLKN